MSASPVVPAQSVREGCDYPYQDGILGSCSESLLLLALFCPRLLGRRMVFLKRLSVWPSTGGAYLGLLTKLVYPNSNKCLSFQWNAMVESPSLSVLLCDHSPLGPVLALVLLAFWRKVH